MAKTKGFKLPKTKEDALAMAKNIAGQTAAGFDPLINYYETERARVPGEQQIQESIAGIFKGAFDTADTTSESTFNNFASIMNALGGAGSDFGTFFSRIAGGQAEDVDPYKQALASEVLKYTMQGRKSAADQRTTFGEAAAKAKGSKRTSAADFLSNYVSLLSTLPSLGGYGGGGGGSVMPTTDNEGVAFGPGVDRLLPSGYRFYSNPTMSAATTPTDWGVGGSSAPPRWVAPTGTVPTSATGPRQGGTGSRR